MTRKHPTNGTRSSPSPPWALGAILAALALLVVLPVIASNYFLSLLIGIFVWAGIASAWNFMAGAGYISLAVGAWYGLGAYSTSVLMNRFGANFYVAAGVSMVWIGLFAVLVSVPLLRLRSHYFIMGSFVVAEVIRLLMKQVRILGLQGGTPVQMPVAYPGEPDAFTRYFYYLGLAFLALVLLLVWYVRSRRMGYALRAIGQDESMAEMMGVATTRYKLTAFGISSALMGLAGAIAGYWIGYLEVDTFFSLLVSIKAVVTVVLGGIGTLFGPVLGVAIIQYIEQRLGPGLAEVSQIIYGLIVVLMIVALPRGTISALGALFTKVRGTGPQHVDRPMVDPADVSNAPHNPEVYHGE